MPASLYSRSGSRTSEPLIGIGGMTALLPIDDRTVLKAEQIHNAVTLASDASVPIPLTNVGFAHVLVARATGGWAKVTIVTTDGTAVLRADPELEIRQDSAPITAISLQRQPATQVVVQLFLGERAT